MNLRSAVARRGFTLIELLVSMTIIAIITSIGMSTYVYAINRGNEGKVRSDLNKIAGAISLLSIDTGRTPSEYLDTTCTRNNESYINYCAAGLVSNRDCVNTSGYESYDFYTDTNWKGPYLEKAMKDPWGTYYFYDPDYYCYKSTSGCEAYNDGQIVRVIESLGPDKNATYVGDNIVRVLCPAPPVVVSVHSPI